jgi:hypothetical protein
VTEHARRADRAVVNALHTYDPRMAIRRLFHVKMIAPLLAGLIGGTLLSSAQLSCGVVEKPACAADQCPAGPTGPAGPPGPSFGSCHWLYTSCAPGQDECVQICPAGTYPVSGSCDAEATATLSEHRASVDPQRPFPASGSPFTAFDRWACQTQTGNMQATYALCCAP